MKEDHTYYLENSKLNDLIIEGEYSAEDILNHNQEKVWDNPHFHKKMLEMLRITKFNRSYLSDKLFDASPQVDSASIAEMFKPKVVQPVIETRLTKEEKKKQARERKREYQKDLQEKIKYGVVEAPKPKLKLATFMRTLANEAIQDPTKVEMEVKKLIEERQQKHIERNEAKKLTKDQKREKMLKKLKKDSAKECKVCIFSLKVALSYSRLCMISKSGQRSAKTQNNFN